MNKVLLAALALSLLAPGARAQSSHPRRVSVTHLPAASHGSTSSHASSGPAYYGTAPILPGTPGPSPENLRFAASTAKAMYAGLSGGSARPAPMASRGLSGGGRHYVFHDGSFWGRRLDAPAGTGSGAAGAGSSPPQQNDPSVPSVIMPGQLIRTAGLGALVSAPDSSPAPFAVEGGKIAYEDSKGYALTNQPGVFTMPKDTPPPPNPSSGGGSAGGNGITENTNVQFNSHSNNGNGNGIGGGN